LARGELRIDERKHTVVKKSEEIPLTRTEFALLLQLAKHPGRVYSRLQLMDEALGDAYIGFERTIDSHIRNLRKKIEDNPVEPQYVLTVFGIGYKFGEGL
jgi:two-component system OmpR family response regulator